MTSIVVLGHGGYAEGIQNNLKMLMGEIENFYFLDFYPNEDLEDFKLKLNKLIVNHDLSEIVFVCDLAGGSPFREACILSIGKASMQVCAGVNIAAISEISYMLDETPVEIAKTCVEVTKDSVMYFNEEDL